LVLALGSTGSAANARADNGARLRADVDRYSFIAVDFDHLLLAGLPALSP
jgi:hypothetical protein